MCVSDTCCADGTKYNATKNKCMPVIKQGFTTKDNRLQGSVIASYSIDNQNTYNGIEPFSYESAYAGV